MLENLRVVLVNTTHPGNIGSAARAMKTMGIADLRLVNPQHFPHADATARASGADDLLGDARVHASLDEALADTVLVFGASARPRHIEWPMLDPRGCAREVRQAGGRPVALVFGREHSGLTNEELDRCHYLVRIPANPDYSSLNIAAAVQILCYELRQASEGATAAESDEAGEEAATQADLERFYSHLEQVLVAIDFLDPNQPRFLMSRLRRLFARARPNEREMNILRGILTAVQKRIG